MRRATSAARSRVLTHAPAPLCAIALRNSPRAAGMREQRADAVGAGRLAEDRDVVGIAAERRDAVAHPLERRDLVEDAGVARTGELVAEQVGEVQEPERPEPVVDRDDDDVAVLRELRAVVPRRRRPSRR